MRLALILAFVVALANPVPQGELLTPCGYTASELESALLCELKPLADEFITAEEETGVNAIFLAAVAALESGWGTSNRAVQHNNLFGWGNQKFPSQAECIQSVAESLSQHYLHPDGKHFNGYTVEAVSIKYNNSDHWRTQINRIMDDIERRCKTCSISTKSNSESTASMLQKCLDLLSRDQEIAVYLRYAQAHTTPAASQ